MGKTSSALRIVYVPGAVDVLQTYAHWRDGRADPSQLHETYSGQFFSLCRSMGWEALVLSSASTRSALRAPGLEIRQRPIPFERSHWVLYHAGQVWEGVRIALAARRFRADVVVASSMRHWFSLWAVKLCAAPVVPSLFCTLWSAREGPPHPSVVRRLNAAMFGRGAAAVMSMSRRITQQVQLLAGRDPASIHEFLPVYDRRLFATIAPPPESVEPFRVLFAGRLERYKGVFDLLEVAESLRRQGEGGVEFDLCGDGPARRALSAAIEQAGLSTTFRLHGHCLRERMTELLGKAHVVIVPTRTDFIEGFNQVIAEAVLAGRPVVSSSVCPAVEYVQPAVVEVAADDPDEYAQAIIRLRRDRRFYLAKRSGCEEAQRLFYDARRSWSAVLREVVLTVTGR
jgi:glycogen synthase